MLVARSPGRRCEFIRHFLIHVLPKGFHRIRHYGRMGHNPKSAAAPFLHDITSSGRKGIRMDNWLRNFRLLLFRRAGDAYFIGNRRLGAPTFAG